MILDTSFFIDLLRNDSGAVSKARELELQNVPLATTSVAVFELWRGFSALNQDKMERACAMLDQLKVYPLSSQNARIGGRIAHALDTIGQEIDPEDAMMAGIALENHEEMLTRNVKHFGRIPNLVVHRY